MSKRPAGFEGTANPWAFLADGVEQDDPSFRSARELAAMWGLASEVGVRYRIQKYADRVESRTVVRNGKRMKVYRPK